ncbi:hypothetical protein F4775DRAFT_120713 [Biscogniauxia sp. FL1348]|nr:hypothetical protein F4775DRAFT_120713 [Biscogniauxia sp. FL1348]
MDVLTCLTYLCYSFTLYNYLPTLPTYLVVGSIVFLSTKTCFGMYKRVSRGTWWQFHNPNLDTFIHAPWLPWLLYYLASQILHYWQIVGSVTTGACLTLGIFRSRSYLVCRVGGEKKREREKLGSLPRIQHPAQFLKCTFGACQPRPGTL